MIELGFHFQTILLFGFQYDVLEPGTIGGGGAYRAQIGFGWSNGFVLVLLDLFGDILNHNDYNDFKPDPTGVDTTSVVNV